jgi:hypothetical protein
MWFEGVIRHRSQASNQNDPKHVTVRRLDREECRNYRVLAPVDFAPTGWRKFLLRGAGLLGERGIRLRGLPSAKGAFGGPLLRQALRPSEGVSRPERIPAASDSSPRRPSNRHERPSASLSPTRQSP